MFVLVRAVTGRLRSATGIIVVDIQRVGVQGQHRNGRMICRVGMHDPPRHPRPNDAQQHQQHRPTHERAVALLLVAESTQKRHGRTNGQDR